MALERKLEFQGTSNLSAQKFSVVIPDTETVSISYDDILKMAKAQMSSSTYKAMAKYFATRCFSRIAVINLNQPSEDTPEELEEKYTEIDYGGMYCINPNSSWDGLCSASKKTDATGAKIVRNLHIQEVTATENGTTYTITPTKAWGGSKSLREYYGDIILTSGKVNLFTGDLPIQRCTGDFIISGVSAFSLCCSTNLKGARTAGWYNTIDIRNVDTSNCRELHILDNYKSSCTVIFGNFSTENWGTKYDDNTDTNAWLFMYNAPSKGRIAVMTTLTPPILKNCKCDNYGKPIYYNSDGTVNTSNNGTLKYASDLDWIKKGKFERIMVPNSAVNAYKTNTYRGQAGTGWSVYADKIYGYNPDNKYTVKTEGENGKPMWIYRASHKE